MAFQASSVAALCLTLFVCEDIFLCIFVLSLLHYFFSLSFDLLPYFFACLTLFFSFIFIWNWSCCLLLLQGKFMAIYLAIFSNNIIYWLVSRVWILEIIFSLNNECFFFKFLFFSLSLSSFVLYFSTCFNPTSFLVFLSDIVLVVFLLLFKLQRTFMNGIAILLLTDL